MEPNAVEQEEDDRIRFVRRLVHQVKNHPNKDALITKLENNRTYNSIGEESKKMINMGNVECFELCKISSKIQGSVLLKVLNRRHRLLYLWNMFDSQRIHKTAAGQHYESKIGEL